MCLFYLQKQRIYIKRTLLDLRTSILSFLILAIKRTLSFKAYKLHVTVMNISVTDIKLKGMLFIMRKPISKFEPDQSL